MKPKRTEPVRVIPDVLYSHLLADLSESWDSDIPPGPEASPRQVASFAMRKSFYKKFVDKVSPLADVACLEKFMQANLACANWDLVLESSADEMLLGEVKIALERFFYPSGLPLITSFGQILDRGKVGPGASLGARGFDFYTKLFSSPLTCTSETLYKIYRDYVSNRPSWAEAEKIRQEQFGSFSVVEGNRLSFVPKSVDVSRSICIEPSLNMFFQLGLKDILEERLVDAFGIDLSTQQAKNAELACLGSMFDDENSYVTIDLSSASDTISLRMLRKILPANVISWFELLRSPFTRLPDGRQVELSMISTMGNGYTFPLQTILFSCIVIAAARVYNRPLQLPYGSSLGNFGVNGDDIVCEKSISRGVIRLLTLLGFSVNSDKSFIEGPFRESCGKDFYLGHMVRGVYLKTLRTPASRYSAINALNLWSGRTGIYLPRTVRYLQSSVRHLPVPLWEQADSGIKVPWSSISGKRRHKHYQSILYEKIEPCRLAIWINDTSLSVPRGQKRRIYNPEGLLISFLCGAIRSRSIGVRHDTPRYRTKRAIAPNWAYSQTSSDIASDERSSEWEFACYANMEL